MMETERVRLSIIVPCEHIKCSNSRERTSLTRHDKKLVLMARNNCGLEIRKYFLTSREVVVTLCE